jgi:HK97 gp10 family phage protein
MVLTGETREMQEHATPAKEPTYERGRRNAALFFFEVIMNIEFTDNSKEVLDLMQQAALRALEKCGLTAEGYAKKLCPVDTGNLQNSITHMVDDGEMAAYVGSNSEYAIYQELGTGEHYPGGRPTPWVYQDAKGNWHWTKGNPAKPFIKPAVADHAQTYRNIIEDELKNG